MAALGSIGAAKTVGYLLAGCLVVGGGGAVYLGALPTVRFIIADRTAPQTAPQSVSLDTTPDGQEGIVGTISGDPVRQEAQPVKPQIPNDPPSAAFDLVRVEADGTALVAGRGVPGQVMDVTVDGDPLGQVTVDGSGQFVGIFDLDMTEAAQLLELRWQTDGAFEVGPDSVIVAPRRAPVSEELAALAPPEKSPENSPKIGPETNPQTPPALAGGTTPAESGGQLPREAPLDRAEPVPQPLPQATSEVAPVPDRGPGTDAGSNPDSLTAERQTADVDLPSPDPAQDPAVQGAQQPDILIANRAGAAPIEPRDLPAQDQLFIDSIAYGADGAVIVQGRSGAPGMLRVSLNGDPVLDGHVLDSSGGWRVDLQDVTPGRYVMRADLINGAGAIVARSETPFLRAAPEAAPKDRVGVDVVTVQPGFTLWRIARDRYGEGTQFVQVFDANQDQIKDPDLIYPGQVLTLPQ